MYFILCSFRSNSCCQLNLSAFLHKHLIFIVSFIFISSHHIRFTVTATLTLTMSYKTRECSEGSGRSSMAWSELGLYCLFAMFCVEFCCVLLFFWIVVCIYWCHLDCFLHTLFVYCTMFRDLLFL